MQKKYIFHYDAGHAWLEVPIKDLYRAGVADRISGDSYRLYTNAYLEEDTDANVFLSAAMEKGWEISVEEVSDGDESPIRKYTRYQA